MIKLVCASVVTKRYEIVERKVSCLLLLHAKIYTLKFGSRQICQVPEIGKRIEFPSLKSY